MPSPRVFPPPGMPPGSVTSGVEFVAPSKPAAILADDIDPMTGELRSLFRGVHPIDGMVVVALRTQRATGASVPDVGSELATLDRVDDALPQRIKFEIQSALSPLVKRRLIRLERVVSAAASDAARAYCEYRNLHTDQTKRVPV